MGVGVTLLYLPSRAKFKVVVYAPAERANTLLYFLLYPFLLCGWNWCRRGGIEPIFIRWYLPLSSVDSVERPDTKDISTLVSAPSYRHARDSNSCSLDLVMRSNWVSQQASLHSSLKYRAGTALGCREVASGKWVYRASVFASDMPSCKHYTARQTVCYMSGMTWSRWGHHCRKTWPQEPFHFSISTLSSRHTGDLNSCSQNLELGVLTKWLARQMLVWVSRKVSLQFFLFISQQNYAFKNPK